jgi:hypothetical protein
MSLASLGGLGRLFDHLAPTLLLFLGLASAAALAGLAV